MDRRSVICAAVGRLFARPVIGLYHDKPTRPSMLKDFELWRAPELASAVLVFDTIAKALDLSAPHIAMMATLARLRFSSLRRDS